MDDDERRRIEEALAAFMATEPPWDSLSNAAFARWSGLPLVRTGEVATDWPARRHAEACRRVTGAIDRLAASARSTHEMTRSRIADAARVPVSALERTPFRRLIAERTSLPTGTEFGRRAMESFADSGVTSRAFTYKRIREHAGARIFIDPAAYRATRQRILARERTVVADPPPGTIVLRDGTWIEPSADQWYLNGKMVRKDDLREDIRGPGWDLMRRLLVVEHAAPASVTLFWYGLRHAAALFPSHKSFAESTLTDVIGRWHELQWSASTRKQVRRAIVPLLEDAAARATVDAEARAVGQVISWLRGLRLMERTGGAVLSRIELESLLAACVADIRRGHEETEAGPFEPASPSWSRSTGHVLPEWTTAMLVLICVLTGLRAESVATLQAVDLMHIRDDLWGLVWRHGKKVEEALAIVPGYLARQIEIYRDATRVIRETLGTGDLLLSGTSRRDWGPVRPSKITYLLGRFVRRHGLVGGDGGPLRVNNTVLRRTFATRALQEGRSIFAVSAQLNHRHVSTTMGYVAFDHFQHADDVRRPLDELARLSLPAWDAPAMLADLSAEERSEIVGSLDRRSQGIGLCREERCVMADKAAPPPCGMCGHLVTDSSFIPDWRREIDRRRIEHDRLLADGRFGLAARSAGAQLVVLERNLEHVVRRCDE